MPTKRCNLRCAICWQRHYGTEWDEFSDDDRWRRLVDESAELGVRVWNLTGGGEPMVRGELILDLCGRILGHGMSGVLQTNGTLFSPEQVARLVAMRWPSLSISLDGPDAGINDSIRSAGAFDKVTRTLSAFQAEKARQDTAFPSITIHTVLTSRNYQSLDRLAELVAASGCETLEVSHLMSHGSSCEAFHLDPAAISDFEGHVAAAIARADALGIQHNLRALVSTPAPEPPSPSPRAPEPALSGRDMSRVKCFEPWLSVAIHAPGHVSPCCIFGNYEQPSILQLSLRDIWLGPYFEQMRALFRQGRLLPECRNCLSNILTRNEAFRQRLLLDMMPAHRRLPFLARKAFAAVRRHGLRRALDRAREWTRIGRDW